MIEGNFITDWLKTQQKTWAHDRSATIGASEIGQCARRTWFAKNDVPNDDGFIDSRGAAHRGDVIEREVWLPALTHWAKKEGHILLAAGEDQETMVDGFLSATPDALLRTTDNDIVLRECKSIDPRVNLDDAKTEHIAQVQVQLGVVANAGRYKPSHAVIDYIDASFVDRLTSFTVEPDPKVYAAAKARALKIMDATDALQLRPEGKMAGGRECERCPWASHCAEVQVAGIPSAQDKPLSGNLEPALNDAIMKYDIARADIEDSEARKSEAQEEIKEILRTHGARRVATDIGSVAWTSVKGRTSVDLKAAAEAGIDLSPFNREGNPGERLSIKLSHPLPSRSETKDKELIS